ncbi:hypothetical protein VTK26DRAFT_5241 [Humicola hyalothermophila]
MAATTPRTPYFAFGSNLWQHQMALRCPSSPFTGLGRLKGWKWFINARGYANIAPCEDCEPKSSGGGNGGGGGGGGGGDCGEGGGGGEGGERHEVWGLVYELSSEDEARLDVNEGVPFAYEKRTVPVEFWPVDALEGPRAGGVKALDDGAAVVDGAGKVVQAKVVDMLVYVDFKRCVGGHLPRREYVVRMNRGIEDALREGVPRRYVDSVLRRWVPAEGEEREDGALKGY